MCIWPKNQQLETTEPSFSDSTNCVLVFAVLLQNLYSQNKKGEFKFKPNEARVLHAPTTLTARGLGHDYVPCV